MVEHIIAVSEADNAIVVVKTASGACVSVEDVKKEMG